MLKNSQIVHVYKLFGEVVFSSLFILYFEVTFCHCDSSLENALVIQDAP